MQPGTLVAKAMSRTHEFQPFANPEDQKLVLTRFSSYPTETNDIPGAQEDSPDLSPCLGCIKGSYAGQLFRLLYYLTIRFNSISPQCQ